jgi:hypothetical protein
LQCLCATNREAIQTIAFQLASFATNRFVRRLLCRLLILGQLFTTRRAEQPAVRARLAVRRDRETFAADLAVFELSRCRSCLLVHLVAQIAVVFRIAIIVRTAFLRFLLRLAFALLRLLLCLLLVLDRIYRLFLFALALPLVCFGFGLRKLVRIVVDRCRISRGVGWPFAIGVCLSSAAFVVISDLSSRDIIGLSMLAKMLNNWRIS